MRKKIIAGNWKMNKSADEALALTSEIVEMVQSEISNPNVIVIICPPYPYLGTIGRLLNNASNIAIGSQNCHQQPSGAYTGEVSAGMLKSLGVQYVLIGHSERRQYFNENNALLAEKTNAVLANNLTPIYCCGETLELRQSGNFLAFVASQLTDGLFHLSAEEFSKTVVAYEPVWAIGTGLTATSAQAQEMHAYLRQHIANQYGQTIADNTTIQYGGSCNEKNAAELFACSDVDGGLIGGASLKSREFTNIIKAMP